MNQISIIGRTTRDIEMRKTQSGMSVIKFTVAVDRNSKDGGTDFIPVTAFGNLADAICKFVRKGDFIGISGHLKIDTKDTSDGRRTFFDVVADRVTFLGSKKQQNIAQSDSGIPQEAKQQWNEEISVDDSDLPF